MVVRVVSFLYGSLTWTPRRSCAKLTYTLSRVVVCFGHRGRKPWSHVFRGIVKHDHEWLNRGKQEIAVLGILVDLVHHESNRIDRLDRLTELARLGVLLMDFLYDQFPRLLHDRIVWMNTDNARRARRC